MEEKRDPAVSSSNAAARLRRSISAARAAEAVEADESFASLDGDDDDSSLVLYRDPSRASAQSRGSVQSGAHEQGDTFFTALKKQPSWQSETGSDLYSCSQAGSKAAGSSCGADSRVNPVQSVSNSGYFSAAGPGSDGGSWLGAGEDSRLGALGPSAESSYASALPASDASDSLQGPTQDDPLTSGGQLTSSVLNIIDSLYGSQAASHRQSWQQQLSVQDQPLRDMPVRLPSASAAAEDLPSAGQEAQQGPSASSGDREQQQDSAAAGCLQEGIVSEQSSSTCAPASTQHHHLREQQDDQQEDSQPDGAAQESPADEDSSADHALLDGMDAMLSERSRLQQELSGYLQQLGSRADEEGEPLVLMNEDYGLLVERMLREGRALQYRALQGWEGPHRFEDLPVAQLRTSHKDPEVAAGLAAIAKLDDELREASLKALVSARALNPEQYADAEKRRLEKRAAELDAALAKERQRRAHAAKLRGVLSRLDEQCSEATLQLLMKGNPSFSYYRLKPQEEELLEAVLSRDESSLEADDPFNPHLLSLDDLQDSTQHVLESDQLSGQQKGHSQAALQLPSMASDISGSSCTQAAAEASGEGLPDAHIPHSQASSAGGSAYILDPVPEAEAAVGASLPVSRLSSGLMSVFSLMRLSSGTGARRHSLAEIDAQLQAMQAERELAQQLKAGQPGFSRSSSSKTATTTPPRVLSAQISLGHAASGIPCAPSSVSPCSAFPSRTCSSAGASRIPSAPAAASGAEAAGSINNSNNASNVAGRSARVSSCSGVGSVGAARQSSISGRDGSRRASAASGSGSSRSSGTVRAIDYIREQREVKELALRERELDAQLRALQTCELPTKLAPQQLQALLQSAY